MDGLGKQPHVADVAPVDLWDCSQKQLCYDPAAPAGLSPLIQTNMGLMRCWNCFLGIVKAHIYQIILNWTEQSTWYTLDDNPVVVRGLIKRQKNSLSLSLISMYETYEKEFLEPIIFIA